MFYNSANPITITLTKKIIFVFINVGIDFLDAYLTRGSGSVEATKRESKDTQPVKKVRTCSVIMRFPQQQ